MDTWLRKCGPKASLANTYAQDRWYSSRCEARSGHNKPLSTVTHWSRKGDDVGVAGIPRYTTVATYTSIFDLLQDQCARPRTWAHFDYLIVLDDALVCVLLVCLVFAL